MAAVNVRRSQDYRHSQDVSPTPPLRSSVAHEPMPQQLMPGQAQNHTPPQGPPLSHLPQSTQPPSSGPPRNHSQGPPPSHLPPFTPPPPSGPPPNQTNGPPPNHLPPFAPPSPSGPSNDSAGGFSSYGEPGPGGMSQMPNSFSPESSAPQQKQGGFRKLIKRRPVSNGHG